jgi:hypothetical protein
VVAAPDPNAAHPFRVVLGSDYNSCVTPVFALRPTPTPVGGLAPAPTNIAHAAAIVGTPPPIDGDLKEWTSLPYSINEPIWGQSNWRGANDLSAGWNAAWDDLFLYLAVRVKDDVFVQTATGENLFKGDSLEAWLDIDPGSRTQALTAHDFQLGISPGNLAQPPAHAEAYLWRPTDQAQVVADGRLGAQLTTGGYDLEVAVPWSTFHLTPTAGEGFAFTLALNDDDQPGTQVQQKQVASLKNAKLTDPTTWGILVLDPPPGN